MRYLSRLNWSILLPALVVINTYSTTGVDVERSSFYSVGKNLTIENRYGIDLIGALSLLEIDKIEGLVRRVAERYPSAFEKLDLVIEDDDPEGLLGLALVNVSDPRYKGKMDIVKMSDAQKIERSRKTKLNQYEDILAHELGHVFTLKVQPPDSDAGTVYESEGMREHQAFLALVKQFEEIDSKVPPIDPSRDRYVGFVSRKAASRRTHPDSVLVIEYKGHKLDLAHEDIVETFAYDINGHGYADDDEFVAEKVAAVRRFMEEVYGN
ncbi:MAG: hypothetical protein ABIH52_02245 [Candidatus Aenigmatarchaeota archaeon]|nr:hypothetical protein [Nanoarchaeota archaeon]